MYFQFWNPDKWKYERFKKHISRKIPEHAVKSELARLVDYWTTELKNGYNPYAKKKEEHSTSKKELTAERLFFLVVSYQLSEKKLTTDN